MSNVHDEKVYALTFNSQTDVEWRRWVSPLSPDARLIWRSLLPAIISKSIFAWDAHDVMVNVRSLVWGVVRQGYPLQWWKPALLWLFDQFLMCRFFS